MNVTFPASRMPRRPRAELDTPAQRLEVRYRTALSGAVVAKARYLAQAGEPGATPAAVERSLQKWLRIDTRRRILAAQLLNLQEMAGR